MRQSRSWFAVLCALSLGGCSVVVDGVLSGKDGGSAASDMGSVPDLGTEPDLGVADDVGPAIDQGALPDLGPAGDLGPSFDLGPGVDMGPPRDAGPAECVGATNGTRCNASDPDRSICFATICVRSTCGDGFIDRISGGTEECEDGNMVNGDGCDNDCRRSCNATDRACNDNNPCTTDTCVQDTGCSFSPRTMGTTCMIGAATGMCTSAGVCQLATCGNGMPNSGEDCDDANTNDDDGCTRQCRFTCTTDVDCPDLDTNRCNGGRTCTVASHTCTGTAGPDCNDMDVCTMDRCDIAMGCVSTPVDADMDGYPPVLNGCGTDCNDSNPNVNPGRNEICGNMVDDDCVGGDATNLTWYADCDGDGFAKASPQTVMSCTMPAQSAITTCSGTQTMRRWITLAPVNAATTDCLDTNATVRPGQTAYSATAISGQPVATDYDYNCDGVETRYSTTVFTTLAPAPACDSRCSEALGWTCLTGLCSPPSCGSSANASSCQVDRQRGTCGRVTGSRTQTCR